MLRPGLESQAGQRAVLFSNIWGTQPICSGASRIHRAAFKPSDMLAPFKANPTRTGVSLFCIRCWGVTVYIANRMLRVEFSILKICLCLRMHVSRKESIHHI